MHYTTKTYRGSGGKLHSHFTALRSCRFMSSEMATSTDCIGDLAGYRAGLNVMTKRKIVSMRESNRGHPAFVTHCWQSYPVNVIVSLEFGF